MSSGDQLHVMASTSSWSIKCHSRLYLLSISISIMVSCCSHPAVSSCVDSDVPSKMTEDATPGITDRILALMNASSISEFHRYAYTHHYYRHHEIL